MFKALLRTLLTRLYRIEITGAEHLRATPHPTLVVANHTSFLDALLLYAFLPVSATYAINTYIARSWMGRIGGWFSELFALDPSNPLSVRSLIRRVREGGWVVIFPEGRITVTGALMKIYQGPGMVADRTHAQLLPVRIEGAQYTRFSRLGGTVRRRWLGRIQLHVQAPRCLYIAPQLRGRARRIEAGRQLGLLMEDLMFETAARKQSLTERLLDARRTHGGAHPIAEDVERKPVSYTQLLTRSMALGRALCKDTREDERVGLMLPGSLAAVHAFWGLQLFGRVPAMLNYSAGTQALQAACTTATLDKVITSRRFIAKAKLEEAVAALSAQVEVVYLEDVATRIHWHDRAGAWLAARSDRLLRSLAARDSGKPAVVLFTSGSEGVPKGVVLSHDNLLANIDQLAARIDFNPRDVALNALPLFHSFGLTAGMLLPLANGVRTFFYPSPLHYRVVPELAYATNATILFGTNTFLAGYARFADPYDFFRLRYVFAGAEKLQDEVRRTWSDRFGVRIFEGYGATETSPVLAANTPQAHRAGSVGRLLPGIEHHLSPVPGLSRGKRLQVRGPNIMLGYLLHDAPGVLVPPATELGAGWYDTGDIVDIDAEGFLHICGRAKRFAKVAGEMVSLTTVETLASTTWPDAQHAAVSLPDARKGEQIVLLTTMPQAQRSAMLATAQQQGAGELSVPRRIHEVSLLPLLGSGKIDYTAARALLEASA